VRSTWTLPGRRLLTLIAAGLIGAFAVIPHLLMHMAEFLGGGVLIAIAGVAGNWCAPRVGLSTPIIDSVLTKQPFIRRASSVAGLAIGVGIVLAVALVALDTAVFATLIAPDQIRSAASAPPLWTSGLAALYGGLTEEIVVRYGVMSLLLWLLIRVVRGPAAYWSAIVGAAMLFGVWHLPGTAEVLPLTPLVVTRTLVLNGLAGVAFGWLYWRRGLEAAMVCHGAANLIVHAALPGIGV
jgi:hypothetical protein